MIIDAFEFMIVRLAVDYVRINSKRTLSDRDLLEAFNDKNDFGIYKCDLFPYLIAIANGKRAELFAFFERNFSAIDNFGIIQKDVHQYLYSNSPQKTTPTLIQFDFTKCKLSLDKEHFNNDALNIEYFLNLHANPSYTNAINSIEHSIKFMHDHRLRKFATLDTTTLSIWSRSNQAYLFYERREELLTRYKIKMEQLDKEFIDLASVEIETNELSPVHLER